MHTTLDRFTCNRCQAQTETERGVQPKGWHRLVLVEPPLANPTDVEKCMDIHLCKACTKDIESEIRKRPTQR